MYKSLVVLAILAVCAMCIASCVPPSAPAQPPAAPKPTMASAAVPTAVPATTLPADCAKYAKPASGGGQKVTVVSPDSDKTQAFSDAGLPPPSNPDVRDSFFPRAEVILAGPADAIQKVVSEQKTGIVLERVGEPVYLGDFSEEKKSWSVELYRLMDPCTKAELDPSHVGTVVEWVSNQRTQNGMPVYADPNYLIGSGDSSLGASPWYVIGSPKGGSGVAKSSDFTDQWALGAGNGIDLLKAPTAKDPRTAVPVYVFDTSPVTTELPNWPNWLQPVGAQGSSSGEACDISDHGLFVAGLINQVSPGSTIYLYQVLNACGQGKLSDLIWKLGEFKKSHEQSDDEEGNSQAIVNLSLTVRWEPKTFGLKNQEDQVSIHLLEDFVKWAYQTGIVLVAAAGNDSDKTPGNHVATQYPAADPRVIGVVASDIDGAIACYSNADGKGASDPWLVKAPAGNGGQKNQRGPECVPLTDDFAECASKGAKCPYGVISIVGSRLSQTGYAYWAGTSFATPLVSGLAARCLGHDKTWSKSLKGNKVADTVWSAIRDGVNSQGVINVPKTLEECKK